MTVEARFTVADSDAEDGKRALNATDFLSPDVVAAVAAASAAILAKLPTALESGRLSVRADGTVALDAPTLAALETIIASGTVALDAPTLAALEQILVTGTVELGATSLAALESITAAGPLTDAQLAARLPLASDVTKVNGTAVDTNSGSKSAGTQRVVLATDQPALTNPLLVETTPATYTVLTRNAAGDPLTWTQNGSTYTATYTVAGDLDTLVRS